MSEQLDKILEALEGIRHELGRIADHLTDDTNPVAGDWEVTYSLWAEYVAGLRALDTPFLGRTSHGFETRVWRALVEKLLGTPTGRREEVHATSLMLTDLQRAVEMGPGAFKSVAEGSWSTFLGFMKTISRMKPTS
jgi:hypothetical protein